MLPTISGFNSAVSAANGALSPTERIFTNRPEETSRPEASHPNTQRRRNEADHEQS
jgi:hypothetical protein